MFTYIYPSIYLSIYLLLQICKYPSPVTGPGSVYIIYIYLSICLSIYLICKYPSPVTGPGNFHTYIRTYILTYMYSNVYIFI